MNLALRFNRAKKWIAKNSLPGEGIAINSKEKCSYPEVTGYLIPSLLNWGEIVTATSYSKWLQSSQLENGAWCAPNSTNQHMFDTGQILKGLISIYHKDPSLEDNIIKGCNWISEQISESGEFIAPDIKYWNRQVPTAVLLYSLEPLLKASKIFNRNDYMTKVHKALDFYLRESNLIDFNCLSHFHAYILEGLFDLGRPDKAREGMKKLEKFQKKDGSVPAYNDVNWVCSTGLFQYAVIWYKLGEKQRANSAFNYACKLQNRSGGWYGSYGWFKKYFPRSEISWSVKYFLDAFHLKLIADFEEMAPIFSDHIEKSDGRYQLVAKYMPRLPSSKILDVGCGKGRYLKNLIQDFPENSYFASDLSSNVMATFQSTVEKRVGSLINLPYTDNSFDYVFSSEALEHAVNTEAAIRELARITKPGGRLVIIDKNLKKLGRMKISDWEQWFDISSLKETLSNYGLEVNVYEGIPYEDQDGTDNVFVGWVGLKRINL
jgi:malonyl-CoA O-methyltransferase